ncbi:MAG: TIGR03667 family PPOX class F420-dependent oxidoreductase [bacterium]|nr:TIGR03667 family PPOX class F420-dependent oxidoreductase [bacterium]
MSLELNSPEFLERINEAYYVWFATVREDGMPQPTPVWFVYENDSFLIYSSPKAQKVKNVQQNGKVALTYASDPHADDYVVVMGEATIDPTVPPVDQNAAYLVKYDAGIVDLGMTRESFTARFSTAIRVRPLKVRGD